MWYDYVGLAVVSGSPTDGPRMATRQCNTKGKNVSLIKKFWKQYAVIGVVFATLGLLMPTISPLGVLAAATLMTIWFLFVVSTIRKSTH